MNTTLLPMVQSVINTLGEEASQHQNSCGEMLLNLLRVSLSCIGVTLMTAQICIYNIFTYGFFNTPHCDNDGMWRRNSESIISLIKESGIPELARWLKQYYLLFGTKTTLPMPTTCCWTLVEYLEEWDHEQYFILLDLMVGFDVSSKVLKLVGDKGNVGQVGATFYAPLVCHVTAAPLWVSSDCTMVTIICPGRCYNASWGRSGGDSPAVIARKSVDETLQQPVTKKHKGL